MGKQNFLPLLIGDVTTMNEPLLVRATALMALLPNFAQSTFLHAEGVGLRELKFLLVAFAQRESCADVHVWMIAPLLIQLAKLFSVAVVGRVNRPGPVV